MAGAEVGVGGHDSRDWITLGLEGPGKEFGFYFIRKCEEFPGGFSVEE